MQYLSPSRLALTLSALLASNQLLAAGFAINEQSVSAMGTAFAGRSSSALDASTVYGNPAGMSYLKEQVSGGMALISAGSDIDHVNAHATSTSIGDVAEANAIRVAGVEKAAVYAPKSALGHSIGAVGALESILTVLALRDGVIPPTLNYETPDPEIDLDVVAGEPRYGDYKYAINNSFGFGGHNVALAFGRY